MSRMVLVTGGAGFIGSHTADLLLKHDYRVRVFDNLSRARHSGDWPDYLDSRVERVKGDVRYKSQLLPALKDVDCIVHLAAWMDMNTNLGSFFTVNVTGTANIYELILKHQLPIKKVVIASSQFVYGPGQWLCAKHRQVFPRARLDSCLQSGQWDPICPVCGGPIKPRAATENHNNPCNQYAISKYTQELIGLRLGKLYHIPTTALRYSITHGPRQSLTNLYSGALRQFYLWLKLGNQLTVYEDGQQLRDFVSVQDVAKANLLALESDAANHQIYNVGGNKPHTVVELAHMVARAMHKKAFINKPGLYRAGDTRHVFSDTTKLKKLGWKPTRTDTQNIKDFIKWADTQPIDPKLIKKSHQQLIEQGILKPTQT